MSRFDELIANVHASGLPSNLSPVPAERIAHLLNTYPDLPPDYTQFLKEIGSGSFGDGCYIIYDGLISPDDVFDPDSASMCRDLLIFGDDFQGVSGAFAPRDGWSVVEIDSTTMQLTPISTSFEGFVKQKIDELVG